MKINSVICDKCRTEMKNDQIRFVMGYSSWMDLFRGLIDHKNGDYDLCTNCMREVVKAVKAVL